MDRPQGEKVISCRTVLRNKFKTDGKLERRKARIVVKGFSQRPGVDFHNTFAPVARISSLRTLMAVAVELDMQIAQIDITAAYLNGKMDTTVHMEKPDMLQEMLAKIVTTKNCAELTGKAKRMLSILKKGDKVCRLNKALYGLRQAGRQWYARLDARLKELGMTLTHADPCVYIDKNKSVLLLTYVDDIVIASRDGALINRLKDELAKVFAVKDLGDIKYCLGIEVLRSGEEIHLSQTEYIRDILDKFGMTDCKTVRTPLETGLKLYITDEDSDDKELDVPYRELLGSLMYLAQETRPDIAHAVSALSQWNSCFKKIHWRCAKSSSISEGDHKSWIML